MQCKQTLHCMQCKPTLITVLLLFRQADTTLHAVQADTTLHAVQADTDHCAITEIVMDTMIIHCLHVVNTVEPLLYDHPQNHIDVAV